MKKLRGRSVILALIFAGAAVFSVHAQEGPEAAPRKFPRAEIFVGFSYTNATLGYQSSLFAPVSLNYYGVHPSLKLNLRQNISVLMEAGGAFGRTGLVPPFGSDTELTLETDQLLFGPEFTLRRPKFNAFAHPLVGVAITTLTLGKKSCNYGVLSYSYYCLGGSDPPGSTYPPIDLVSRRNLALGFGGGLDINWKRHFGVRLFQADYIPTRVNAKWEQGFRVSTGFVLKF